MCQKGSLDLCVKGLLCLLYENGLNVYYELHMYVDCDDLFTWDVDKLL